MFTKKYRKKSDNKEQLLQKSIVLWFSFQYPKLNGLLFHVNNNSNNVITGGNMKKLGVIPGVSDLIFLFDGRCYFIELKSKKGSQSSDQKIWQKKVEQQNFNYRIIKSLDEFKAFIKQIIEA